MRGWRRPWKPAGRWGGRRAPSEVYASQGLGRADGGPLSWAKGRVTLNKEATSCKGDGEAFVRAGRELMKKTSYANFRFSAGPIPQLVISSCYSPDTTHSDENQDTLNQPIYTEFDEDFEEDLASPIGTCVALYQFEGSYSTRLPKLLHLFVFILSK